MSATKLGLLVAGSPLWIDGRNAGHIEYHLHGWKDDAARWADGVMYCEDQMLFFQTHGGRALEICVCDRRIRVRITRHCNGGPAYIHADAIDGLWFGGDPRGVG